MNMAQHNLIQTFERGSAPASGAVFRALVENIGHTEKLPLFSIRRAPNPTASTHHRFNGSTVFFPCLWNAY
jgi:hypothetical protein